MNKTKKIVLIIACVLLGIGLVVGCVGLCSLGFDFRKLETYKLQTRVYEFEEDFTSLHLDMRTADLTLLPAQDNKTKVVCEEKENQPHSVLVKDGALTIEVEDNRKWYEYIGFNFGKQTVTVYLPKSEYAKITVDVNTGDVHIPKEFLFNQAKITSNTGDVVWSAGVSEGLAIETDTGEIEVGSLTSEASLELKSDTGDMEIFDITCKTLTIETNTGDLELDRVIIANALTIETDTGEVEINDSDAGTVKVVTDTGDVSGVWLSDKIFITQTHTGDVDVPKTTSGGVCEVHTDTGDIWFRIK